MFVKLLFLASVFLCVYVSAGKQIILKTQPIPIRVQGFNSEVKPKSYLDNIINFWQINSRDQSNQQETPETFIYHNNFSSFIEITLIYIYSVYREET